MPEGDSEPRSPVLRWVRWSALLGVVLLAVTGGLLIWWHQVPTEDDLKEQAGLKGRSELAIGVKDDMPGIGYYDEETKTFSGFDIEIGYLIAADLGFRRHEVRFTNIENEDRSRMRDSENNPVDLVIATYSSTEDRAQSPTVTFSAPYLETEQSVLTLADHPPLVEMTQLRGKRVCTLSTSTSTNAAAEAGAEVVYTNKIRECVEALYAGKIDAVTTDAAILGGFTRLDPHGLRHHDISLETPELWAVNTGSNEALRKLVDLSLHRSRNDPNDSRWEDAFDKYLRPIQAASFPTPIANDTQPPVPEVSVRLWPWERQAGATRLGASSGR